jgi:hypothetical protein
MGLTATFAVTATGSSLQYQWRKNGALILGATASTYVTPATTFADSGASYQVTVSNSAGAVSSNAATLTVTARAPRAGDLRFQQVDAPSTVNGWGHPLAGLSTDVPGRGAAYYSPSIGTPLYVGSNGNCAPPSVSNQGVSCAWFYSTIPFAPAPGGSLTTGYAGDFYADFQSDLQNPATFYNSEINPMTSGSVITSLDLEPGNNLFGLSWVQPTPPQTPVQPAQ